MHIGRPGRLARARPLALLGPAWSWRLEGAVATAFVVMLVMCFAVLPLPEYHWTVQVALALAPSAAAGIGFQVLQRWVTGWMDLDAEEIREIRVLAGVNQVYCEHLARWLQHRPLVLADLKVLRQCAQIEER